MFRVCGSEADARVDDAGTVTILGEAPVARGEVDDGLQLESLADECPRRRSMGTRSRRQAQPC
eukprot:2113190-Prorocentrum_lima.AAC.1